MHVKFSYMHLHEQENQLIVLVIKYKELDISQYSTLIVN